MSKKLLATLLSFVLLTTLVLPVVSNAALVNCDGVTKPCDFGAFIGLINDIIKWIISIAGVIFTISFIYGGFLYMTSGINGGNKDKAKDVLWSTLKGFVIILIAWLIVYTILNVMIPKEGSPYRQSIFKFIGEGKK